MISGVESIHFIGIAGTAMASAAAAMKEQGYQITGSDSAIYPPMSDFLKDRGIEVMNGYAETNLAHSPDLVVVGNAISRGNPEAEVTLERKLRYCSLPELLKEFFIRGKRCVVVTGTHGKTTTTSLLTWVFEKSGLNPSFLIGGIPNNLKQGARFTDSEWFIIEGDEYDTAFFDKRSKFLHYLPEVVIMNNLEFDHADIFPNIEAIEIMFRRLINIIPRNGLLLCNGDDQRLVKFLDVDHCPIKRFGMGDGNDVRADDLNLSADKSEFTMLTAAFRIGLVGELNVRNALGVAAAARHCGLSDSQIQEAFDTFEGIKRRMEIRGEANGVTVVDDFGHHPTAIRETLRALRIRFPDRRIWAVFEPRTNSTRRNVFQEDLVRALERADQVIVAEVARLEKLPVEERLDPAKLMNDLKLAGIPSAYLPNVEAIVDRIVESTKEGDVVCVFSNGGFGDIHEKLLSRLRELAE